MLDVTDALVKSEFIERFDGITDENCIRFEECCKTITGGNTPSMTHPEYYGGDIPFIKSGDVKTSEVSIGSLTLTQLALQETSAKIVPAGSILLVVRSAILTHELPVSIAASSVVINQDIKALEPTSDYDSHFLYWVIKVNEPVLLQKVKTMLTSHIEIVDVLNLRVPKVSLPHQKAFRDFVEQADKCKLAVQQSLDSLTTAQKALMNQCFQ